MRAIGLTTGLTTQSSRKNRKCQKKRMNHLGLSISAFLSRKENENEIGGFD